VFLAEPFASNYAEPKLVSWAEPGYFDFSSSNFTVEDYIPSTAGDALRSKILCGCERSKRKERVCVGAHLSSYRPRPYNLHCLSTLPRTIMWCLGLAQVAQMAYSDRPRLISEDCFSLHNHRWLHKQRKWCMDWGKEIPIGELRLVD